MKFTTKILAPLSILSIVTIFAISTDVFAQNTDGLTVDTFRPAPSANSLFQLILPTPKEHLKWSVGGMVHYSHHPVRRTRIFSDDGQQVEDYPLNLRLQADLAFAIGIRDILELGLSIPVIMYQNSDGDGLDVQPAGVGDPRIDAKVRFYHKESMELGAGITASIPLGYYVSSGADFMGSRAPTVEPKFIAAFLPGRAIIGVNLGYLIRPITETGGFEQNMAFTWSAGFGYDIRDFDEFGGIRVGIENNGQLSTPIDGINQFPWEIILGAKYRTNKDVIIEGGGGLGLTDALGTPLFRLFAGVYYDQVLHNCPAGPEDFDNFEDNDKCIDPDNDNDGFLDELDKCPNQPEDKDGYQDEDGCPDKDNDNDGIPDVLDDCPMLAEDADDFEDDDGCPEEGPGKASVKITDSQLLLSSKIYFDYNKDTIKSVSFPILDAVAVALLTNKHINNIRVEGHTDNEGTEEYNLELSERRAKSVVEYLIGKSVEKERLTYEGYGFSQPKASNKSEEGRAINRRVEFTIISKEE